MAADQNAAPTTEYTKLKICFGIYIYLGFTNALTPLCFPVPLTEINMKRKKKNFEFHDAAFVLLFIEVLGSS